MFSKKKIAFVGSSLITLLHAKRLAKDFDCYIFDKSAANGGAWAGVYQGNRLLPNYNNLICPASSLEEKFIQAISDELQQYSQSITIRRTALNLLTNYVPESYILGNFSEIVNQIINETKIHINKTSIFELSIFDDFVEVNSECFDYVFFNQNFSFHKLHINGQPIEVNSEIIISKHVTVFFDKELGDLDYTEDFDNVFDRASFYYPDRRVFVARIRKASKDLSIKQIVKNSEWLSKNSNFIESVHIRYYENDKIQREQLGTLSLQLINKPATIIETRQFVNSYIQLQNYENNLKDLI